MIIALLTGLIIGALAIWRPALATAAIIFHWPAYLMQTTIVGVPTTVLELALYGAVMGTTIAIVSKRWPRPQLRFDWWTMILVLCWSAAWIVAVVASPDQRASLGAWKAWWLDAALFSGLLFVTVRSVAERTLMIRALIASGTVVALAGLGQLAFLRDTLQEGRLSSFYMPVANYAAMFLAPIFVFGVALVLHRSLSRIWIGPLSVIALALVGTQSLGGMLAVSAGLGIVWLSLPTGILKRRLLWSAVTAGAAILLILFVTGKLTQRFDLSDRSSGSARIQIWVTSWAIGTQNPILGIGPNAFEVAYRDELPKHYFPPLEWLVAQPHNLYLALWLELGLAGLFVFVGSMYYWFRGVIRQMNIDSKRTIAIAASAAVCTILVHGLVDTPILKSDLMLLTVTLLMLPWLAKSESA